MKKISILATLALATVAATAAPVQGIDYMLSANKCTVTILTKEALANYTTLSPTCQGSEKKYVLGADIKISETLPKEPCTTNLSIYNTGLAGNFDGAGYTISNICVSDPNNSASLFGAVGSALTIENLTIDGIVVNSGASNGNTSALLGEASSNLTIRNVHVKNATVKSKTINVGGLLGASNSGTRLNVVNSSFEGTINEDYTNTSESATVGGLVGKIKGDGKISSSYFKGQIKANAKNTKVNVGGLLGMYMVEDSILVERSYATNEKSDLNADFITVTLDRASGYNVAGLVAHLQTYINNTTNAASYVNIYEVFAKGAIKVTGTVTGTATNYIGGLIGWDSNANWYMLKNSYYLGAITAPTADNHKVYGLTSSYSTYFDWSKTGTGNYNGNVRSSYAFDANGTATAATQGMKSWGTINHAHGQFTIGFATKLKTNAVKIDKNADFTENSDNYVLASAAFANLLEKYDEDEDNALWFYNSSLNDGFPSLVNVPSYNMTLISKDLGNLKIQGTKLVEGSFEASYVGDISTSIPVLSSIKFNEGTGYLNVHYETASATKDTVIAYETNLSLPGNITSITVSPLYVVWTNVLGIELKKAKTDKNGKIDAVLVDDAWVTPTVENLPESGIIWNSEKSVFTYYMSSATATLWEGDLTQSFTTNTTFVKGDVDAFNLTLNNIAEANFTNTSSVTTYQYQTSLAKGENIVPRMNFILNDPVGAQEDSFYVVFAKNPSNYDPRKYAYGDTISIPADAKSAEIYEIATYAISIADTADKAPIFKAADATIPVEYTYGDASVVFPKVASLKGCFTGWEVNSVALVESAEGFVWQPGKTSGTVTATPKFDLENKCNETVSLVDNSTLGVSWGIYYGAYRLNETDNATSIEIPNLPGVSYKVSAVANDESETVSKITFDEADIVDSFTYLGTENTLEIEATASNNFFYVAWKDLNDDLLASAKTGVGNRITSVHVESRWVTATTENLPAGGFEIGAESVTYFADANDVIWDGNLEKAYSSLTVYRQKSIPTFTVTLDNLDEMDVEAAVSTTTYATQLSVGTNVLPKMTSLKFTKPSMAMEENAYIIFTTSEGILDTVMIEYEKVVAVPANAVAAEILENAVYTIAIADTADFYPIFKKNTATFPTSYSFGETVTFPKIASLDACFTGWKINGEDLLESAEGYEWNSGKVFGNITATPVFDDTRLCNVTITLNSESEYGINLEVYYESNLLDIYGDDILKVDIPDLSGITYTVSAFTNDESESVSELTWAKNPIDGQFEYAGETSLEIFAKATQDFYYIHWNDEIGNEVAKAKTGLNNLITSVYDNDSWIEVSVDIIPAGSYEFNAESKTISYFANGNVLWEADLQKPYSESTTFTKYVADLSKVSVITSNGDTIESLDNLIWNTKNFDIMSTPLPTVIFSNDKGKFQIAKDWAVSTQTSEKSAVNSLVDIAEFARANINEINTNGINAVLDLDKAVDYNLSINVAELDTITATCELFGEKQIFKVVNGEGNVPQCSALTFDGGKADSLHIVMGSDTIAVAYGDQIKIPEGTTELGVSEKPAAPAPEEPTPVEPEPDVFNVDSASIALSGSAVKLAIGANVASELTVALNVKLISADSVIADTVITDSAETKIYEFEYYPLAPGEYYAEIVLASAQDTVAFDSENWTIDSVAMVLAAGEWNLISLANVEKVEVPNEDEGYVYYWDEDKPIGDFWQYRTIKNAEELEALNGYWYFVEDTTVLLASKNPTAKTSDSVSWELKNNFSGWNMIANPYSWKIALNASNFEDPESDGVTFWRWNAATAAPEVATVLDENAAVWVKASEAAALSVDASPVYVSELAPTAENKPAAKSSWSLRLKLQGENGKVDSWNVVGVGSREINVEEPPAAMNSGVSLAVVDGSKSLAKAIKNPTANASWNVALKANTLQKAKLSVEGLEKLEELGLYATLELDGQSIPLNANEDVDVTISALAKSATLKVNAAKVASVKAIDNLRYSLDGHKMHVSFNLASEMAGKAIDVRLIDARGNTISFSRDRANAGENKAMLNTPASSGIFFLNVTAGSQSKRIKLKF